MHYDKIRGFVKEKDLSRKFKYLIDNNSNFIIFFIFT